MPADQPKAKAKSQVRRSIGARKNPETEDAILDAAAQIIADKGIAGLSMEGVARAAKAGKATLYRWWPSRGALLMAVYQKKKPTLLYQDTGTLKGDITHFTKDLMVIWRRMDGLFFKAIIAEAQSDPDVADILQTYQAERREALLVLFERAVSRGELPDDGSIKARVELLMGCLWLRLITNRLDEPLDQQIEQICRP